MTSGSLGGHAFVLPSTGACRAARWIRERRSFGERRSCGPQQSVAGSSGRPGHRRCSRLDQGRTGRSPRPGAGGADGDARHVSGARLRHGQLRRPADQRLRLGHLGDQLLEPHRLRQRDLVQRHGLRHRPTAASSAPSSSARSWRSATRTTRGGSRRSGTAAAPARCGTQARTCPFRWSSSPTVPVSHRCRAT